MCFTGELVYLPGPEGCFLILWLAPISHPLFVFEWENPLTGRKPQLTWMRLLQGFKNAPTFEEALATDLSALPRETVNCPLL